MSGQQDPREDLASTDKSTNTTATPQGGSGQPDPREQDTQKDKQPKK